MNYEFDLSVLIVNYNTAYLFDEFFGTLRSAITNELTVQIIVVDNASADNSVSLLRARYPEVELVVSETNIGFGRANNLGLPLVRGRYVLLLNTDAFVGPETLTRTLAYMDANPLCGVLGVKLIGRDGMLQPSCRFFPEPLNMFVARAGFTRLFKGLKMVDDMNWDHSTVRPCDWVPGCYYLTRREVLERVGLFDPRYFMYFEEVDHCRRVKDAGWEVVFYPHTSAIHIGGESAKSQGEITRVGRQLETLQIESEVLYIRKHYGYVGLCMHVVLVLLGEAILGIKAVIRARKDQTVSLRVKKMSLFLAIAFRTRFGSQPTR